MVRFEGIILRLNSICVKELLRPKEIVHEDSISKLNEFNPFGPVEQLVAVFFAFGQVGTLVLSQIVQSEHQLQSKHDEAHCSIFGQGSVFAREAVWLEMQIWWRGLNKFLNVLFERL
jgi:hypothetical protein